MAEHTPTAVPATRGSTTDSLDSSGTVPPASGNDNNGGIFLGVLLNYKINNRAGNT